MGVLAWIVFGAIAGWIAAKLAGNASQQGCLTNIIVGIAGAAIGGGIYKLISGNSWDFDFFDLGSFVVAILGSLVLLIVLNAISRRT
ncbi:MAG: GlsB/YeaQ/YmgE family stress response membrane protein [Thermomicrobiales bacterium]